MMGKSRPNSQATMSAEVCSGIREAFQVFDMFALASEPWRDGASHHEFTGACRASRQPKPQTLRDIWLSTTQATTQSGALSRIGRCSQACGHDASVSEAPQHVQVTFQKARNDRSGVAVKLLVPTRPEPTSVGQPGRVQLQRR